MAAVTMVRTLIRDIADKHLGRHRLNANCFARVRTLIRDIVDKHSTAGAQGS